MDDLKEIPGFTEIKLLKHGRYWYIIDCTPDGGDPCKHSVGGYHERMKDALAYADKNYIGEFR